MPDTIHHGPSADERDALLRMDPADRAAPGSIARARLIADSIDSERRAADLDAYADALPDTATPTESHLIPDGTTYIDTYDRGTVTLGRTTYEVREHVYRDGRYPSSTYLIGPRGALYLLRPYLGNDTGLRQVISMASGAELRVRGNRVQVWHIGNVIETTKPVI